MPYIETPLKLEDLPIGATTFFELKETQVGVFRTEEGLFALDNFCPHRGAPLHDGHITDGYVTCPWHQWQFQLKDGVCRNIPGARAATFPIEVRDGAIWIDLEDKGAAK